MRWALTGQEIFILELCVRCLSGIKVTRQGTRVEASVEGDLQPFRQASS